MINNFFTLLEEAFFKAKIEYSKAIAEKFFIYYELLLEYNKKVNLTAITDMKEVINKHFVDSLLPLSTYYLKENVYCIDVGTGAGFPGVPLAIMRPDINMTLLDSLNKRLVFLQELCEQLELNNCTIVHARAEDAARDKYRESFDISVSRGVSQLNILTEYCLPFVKTGGYMLSLKSLSAKDEIENAKHAVDILGGKVIEIFGTEERNIVVIEKQKPTPSAYPRRAGKPEKQPL